MIVTFLSFFIFFIHLNFTLRLCWVAFFLLSFCSCFLVSALWRLILTVCLFWSSLFSAENTPRRWTRTGILATFAAGNVTSPSQDRGTSSEMSILIVSSVTRAFSPTDAKSATKSSESTPRYFFPHIIPYLWIFVY